MTEENLIFSRQDRILMQLQQAAIPVAIYLKNVIKLQGTIMKFDSLVIMLRSPTAITQMIFKHTILTFQSQ